MKKWRLIIDLEKCEDCNNCFLACKDEHVDNDWPGYTQAQPRHGHRWINIFRKERGRFPIIDVAYRPTPCMHCDAAPCITAAANQAVYKRDDGIVMIDPEKARGQKDLIQSCPYGAIWWNGESNVPQKCTLCAHLLDEGWSQPRCVQACPTGALKILSLTDEEMTSAATAQALKVLNPEFHTRPNVYYQNLYRFNQCFIAGSLAVRKKDVEDCAQGAKVSLYIDSTKIDEIQSDAFGDFKFDRLEENSGRYQIEIEYAGFETKQLDVDVSTSVSFDTVFL